MLRLIIALPVYIVVLVRVLCAGPAPDVASERVLWTRMHDSSWEQAVALDRESFKEQNLLQRARRIVAQRTERFVRVYFPVIRGVDFETEKPTHLNPLLWHDAQIYGIRTAMSIAELISINGNAVLRIRDGLSVKHVTVAGADPLVVDVSDNKCEVLHVAVLGHGGGLALFVSCMSVDQDRINALSKALDTMFAGQVAFITIRTDPWFIREPKFPRYFWFDRTEVMSYEDAVAAPEARCVKYETDELASCRLYP